MTIERHMELDCPNCGAGNRIVVWDSINAQVDPDAKQALLCGEINVLACQRCGEIIRIEKSLLYHDMENRFMVWYVPFAWVLSGEVFSAITPDRQINAGPYLPGVDYAGSIHYVFDMDELVRYIKFRDVLAKKAWHASG